VYEGRSRLSRHAVDRVYMRCVRRQARSRLLPPASRAFGLVRFCCVEHGVNFARSYLDELKFQLAYKLSLRTLHPFVLPRVFFFPWELLPELFLGSSPGSGRFFVALFFCIFSSPFLTEDFPLLRPSLRECVNGSARLGLLWLRGFL